MKIAFATAQSLRGSTNIGRIMPLAAELQKKGHTTHILALTAPNFSPESNGPSLHFIGREPFRRTSRGKDRLKGVRLVCRMLDTAIRTALTLKRLKPDVVVISKPLPSNVAGVLLYSLLTTHYRLILDADDFELTANKLSSIYQRAVIHWASRRAAQMAEAVIAASPFLADHFKQLTQNAKPVEVIATGISSDFLPAPYEHPRPWRGEGPVTLAYFGSVSVSSGHRVDMLPDILEKLVAKHSHVHLLIAGDGDNVAALKNEFSRRGLTGHVSWHGRFHLRELPSLIPLRTIVLDPVDGSIANRAKSSFRVVLAAILGLPIITSNIGIRPALLPSVLHERFFAEPGLAGSYTEKISALLSDPLTESEQALLQAHAREFTWAQGAAAYHDIITRT